MEPGAAEAEHPAVAGGQPVAVRCGSEADDRLPKRHPGGRAGERSGSEGEDAAITRCEPVTVPARGCLRVDDRAVEGCSPEGAEEWRAAEPEDAAVGRGHPVPLAATAGHTRH